MQSYVIIVPAYNVEGWIGHCLGSIRMQTLKKNQNVKVIVIDDYSTDKTWDIINQYPFISHRNEVHNGSVIKNIVKALDIVKPDFEDVVMILDGDDWFANKEVFATLDEVYKEYVWFAHSQFEPVSKTYKNFCKPISDTKTYRKNEEWKIGQLRTWKHWLWDHVLDCDLRDNTGEYFTVAGDRPYIYPMIEMAGKHIRFIDNVLYTYNDLNPINEFRIKPREATEMAKFIISRKEYKEL